MSFFKKVSIETAHQSKKLEKNNMAINMAINMAYTTVGFLFYFKFFRDTFQHTVTAHVQRIYKLVWQLTGQSFAKLRL